MKNKNVKETGKKRIRRSKEQIALAKQQEHELIRKSAFDCTQKALNCLQVFQKSFIGAATSKAEKSIRIAAVRRAFIHMSLLNSLPESKAIQVNINFTELLEGSKK